MSKERRREHFTDAFEYLHHYEVGRRPGITGIPAHLKNERVRLPCPRCRTLLDSNNCDAILHTETYQRWEGVKCAKCQMSFRLDTQ